MKRVFCTTLLIALLSAGTGAAQPPRGTAAPAPAGSVATYADLADLGLVAPVAAHVRLRRIMPLSPADSAGVAAGNSRFYLEAEIIALIKGSPATPLQVSFLADLPNRADGRPERPARRSEWIIFARAVAGRPDQLQLIRPDALLPHSPDMLARIRALLREAAAPDAPPAVAAIGRAFYTPGSIPGTGQTQIFMQTPREQPISATIVREQGAQPRWFVSTSEFVEAGAVRPREGTLVWYRLACFLPQQLPPASLADAGGDRAQIVADYRLFRDGLGPCPRLRGRR